VLQLRGSGGPWLWRLAAYRTDADRSNAPRPPAAPLCPSTSAAAAASASSSMDTEALAESLPPPPPRPREEVEERRFACSGGDLFPDGQGSERQDISEPIGPSRVDSVRGKSLALLLRCCCRDSGELDEEGKEEEAGGGRRQAQAGSGRGRNGSKRIRKFILLLVPPLLHIRAPCLRNFVSGYD